MKPFILSLLVSIAAPMQLSADLVARYKFDETAGTIAADELGGSDAIIEGAVGFVPGVDGGAFSFDGNVANNVTIANAPFLSGAGLGTDFTISVWVSFTDVGSNVGTIVCLVNQSGPANSYTDLSRIGNGAFGGGINGSFLGRTRIGNAITQSTGGGAFNDGNFHHVAFVIDSTNGSQEVHVDGELVSSIVGDPKIAAFTDLTIGHLDRPDGAGQTDVDAFTGLIDDMQLYSRALDESEIAFLHEHPGEAIGGPQAPVVASDSATMHHQNKVLLDVLANDSGAIDASSVEIVVPPASGTAAPVDSGLILYSHAAGSPASDSFTYRVANPDGAYSEPATVTITFSTNLRIANTTVQVPDAPPAVDFAIVDAFPGLTFIKPTTMESPAGDPNRLFVAERGGKIHVIPDVTATPPVKSLYLDLSAITLDDGNEQGLKGFAFHPDFATNGYLFVAYNYSDGTSEFVRLSRFHAPDPANNSGIPAASEEILIHQLYLPESGNQPRIHNIDECNFGPDGYLYVGLGDADGHPDPSDNSQRIDRNFWSALLRIDVDLEPEDHTPADGTGGDDAGIPPNLHDAVVLHGGSPLYEIPADNPFIGATGFNGIPVDPDNIRTEFFAVGLRNPWQFSFDPANGNLWLADVGLGDREEINLVTSGGNYGWAFFEGSDARKGVPPEEAVLTGPVWEYDHGNGPFQGKSVIGGLVYRGDRYPTLQGKYLFADYVSGNVWAMTADGGPPVVERIAGEAGIVAFATDPSDSSLLMLDHGDGVVRRLVATTSTEAFPETLGATGIFADLADLSPNPGVVPYEPNLPFWSDHAIKRRWFVIKNTTDQLTWSQEDAWQSPPGTVFVKHFDLELERGNPASRKRIETRLLARAGSGIFGVSYRWNESGTEATLAPDEGVSFDLDIVDGGLPKTQTWQIPSRAQCTACHNDAGGLALSFNTAQLNRDGTLAGVDGNFLSLLHAAGYLDQLPESPRVLPRHVRPDESQFTLGARARSYLAVNCSYCHRDGGSGGGDFDLRRHLSLAETGTIGAFASDNGDDPANRLIAPGSHQHSVIWNRAAAANGFSRMPPLASSEIDQAGVAMLQAWIDGELDGYQTYDEWRIARFGDNSSAEGEATGDPDHDGNNNRAEYLAGTLPLDAASAWRPEINITGDAFTFANLPGRRMQVETTTDLTGWSVWDVPDNDGSPKNGPARSLRHSSTDPYRFFRIRFEED